MDGAYNDVLSQWYARPGNVDIEKGLPYGSTILNVDGTAPATSPATRYPSNPHRHRLTKSAPYPGHEDEYLSRLRVTRSDPADVEDCLNPKNCPYHPNATRTPLYNINTYNGTVRAGEAIPTYHDAEPVKPNNFARWMMPIFGHVPRNPSIVSSVGESEKGKRGRSRGSYYFCRRCMIFECMCWFMFIIIVLIVPVYILYVLNASPAQLYPLAPPEPQVIPGTPPSTIFPWFREPPGDVEPVPTPVSAPPHKPFDDGDLDERHISERVDSSLEAPLILSRHARFGRRPHHGTIKEIQGAEKLGEHDKAERSPLLNPIVEPFPTPFTVSEVSSIPDQSRRRQLFSSEIQQKAGEALQFLENMALEVKEIVGPHHWFGSKSTSFIQKRDNQIFGFFENTKRYMDPHHWFGAKAEESLDNRQPIPSEVQKRDNEAGMNTDAWRSHGWFGKSTLGSSVIQERASESMEFFETASQTVKKYMDPHHWFGSKLEESSNSREPSSVRKRANEALELLETTASQVKDFMDPHHWFGSKSEEFVRKFQGDNRNSDFSSTGPYPREITATLTEKPTALQNRIFIPPISPSQPSKCEKERCPSAIQIIIDWLKKWPLSAKVAVPSVFGWLVIVP